MRAAVIVFPGSNCDRDMQQALIAAGADVTMVWHKDASLPDGVDLVAIPGGFSFGDYLRCGAIAAKSPICRAVVDHANRGGFVLGVCNGFQVLTETGLLPGALIQNAGLKFLCKTVDLQVSTVASDYTSAYSEGQTLRIPIAHHEGNFRIDEAGLKTLQNNDRVAFRYSETPNGAEDDIAGILSENRRVLGMMPHPERAISDELGSDDGTRMFTGLVQSCMAA